MKFATIPAATLLAAIFPLAQAGLLRSQDVSTFSSGGQIILQGVRDEFSTMDLAIIGDSAKTAYDSVYKKDGFSLESVSPVLNFGIEQCHGCLEQCHGCTLEEATLGGKVLMADFQIEQCHGCVEQCHGCVKVEQCHGCVDQCHGCADHEAFVSKFCELVKTGGSTNLASTRSCSISFLGEPGHVRAPLDVASKTQAAMSVSGLIHDLSQADLDIIDSNLATVYNDAFLGTESTISTGQCHGCVEQCHGCESKVEQCHGCVEQCHGCGGKVVLTDVEIAQCHGCGLEVGSPEYDYAISAMSNALCAKLRNSGSANLANAKDCAVNFLAQHRVSASSA